MHLELSVIPFYYKTCSEIVKRLIRQFEIKMRLNRELFIFNGGFLYHFKTLDENLKQKKILFNAGDIFFLKSMPFLKLEFTVTVFTSALLVRFKDYI